MLTRSGLDGTVIEMFSLIHILTAVVVVILVYWWHRKKGEKKLRWIPKVPGHPIFGNVLDFGESTDTLRVLSGYLKQHGGICSVNLLLRNIVVISDLKVLEFLLTSTKILDKSREYRFLNRWLGNGLLTGAGARWRKSRKIITPGFHFSILGQFISMYEANADILVKLLEAELEKDSVDIYPYITMCTLDIICETSMGVSLNAQEDRKSDYVLAVKEMCRITVDRGFSAIKHSDLLYMLTKDFYKERTYVKTLHSYTDSVILSRRRDLLKQSEDKEKDMKDQSDDLGAKKKVAFLDLLLQARPDGKPLPDWYIREEVDTLMFEGHDTTSAGISFALHCLVENPEVQAKAFEEQRRIFGEDRNRPTTQQDIQEMKYLELVIKETLRLYPPVPFYARTTDTHVEYKDGQEFPKGATLMIFAYGIHRNPEIFPDPDKFDPTRFQNMDRSSPFAYLPFSAGPRNCIGQKFAMQELKVVLSKILRSYELLPATPKHNLVLAAETVLKSANGIKMKIIRRNWC